MYTINDVLSTHIHFLLIVVNRLAGQTIYRTITNKMEKSIKHTCRNAGWIDLGGFVAKPKLSHKKRKNVRRQILP